MFTPEEWTVIRAGLDVITIQGKDADGLFKYYWELYISFNPR